MSLEIRPRKQLLDELPSILLLTLCYGAYAAISLSTITLGVWPSIGLLALVLVLHSSLQHEFIHGHPTSNQQVNDFLVSPAIGLYIPYLRFKDTHLAHHYDPNLTDPYDDPESNFLDPKTWHKLPKWRQHLGNFNNTLFGRMTVGPLLGTLCFYSKDFFDIRKGNRRILGAYFHHLGGLALVATWHILMSTLPIWAYLIAAYFALSILKIRTFLEHKAHDRTAARTVLIEDRGILALLFLNNNFHAVHHTHPRLVWHRLPEKFKERQEVFLDKNEGYWFRSYRDVFRLYFFNRKDPVPHPLMDGFQQSGNLTDNGSRDLAIAGGPPEHFKQGSN